MPSSKKIRAGDTIFPDFPLSALETWTSALFGLSAFLGRHLSACERLFFRVYPKTR